MSRTDLLELVKGSMSIQERNLPLLNVLLREVNRVIAAESLELEFVTKEDSCDKLYEVFHKLEEDKQLEVLDTVSTQNSEKDKDEAAVRRLKVFAMRAGLVSAGVVLTLIVLNVFHSLFVAEANPNEAIVSASLNYILELLKIIITGGVQ